MSSNPANEDMKSLIIHLVENLFVIKPHGKNQSNLMAMISSAEHMRSVGRKLCNGKR